MILAINIHAVLCIFPVDDVRWDFIFLQFNDRHETSDLK